MTDFRDLRARYQRVDFLGNLAFALFSVVAIYLAMSARRLHRRRPADHRRSRHLRSAAAQLRALVEGSIATMPPCAGTCCTSATCARSSRWPRAAADAAAAGAARRRHRVRDVTFTYPGAARPTLANSRSPSSQGKRRPGGDNGAGKTTIAKLMRASTIRRRAVLFDGIDARDLDLPTSAPRDVPVPAFRPLRRHRPTTSLRRLGAPAGRRGADRDGRAGRGRPRLISAMPQGYRTMLGRTFRPLRAVGRPVAAAGHRRAIARDARI